MFRHLLCVIVGDFTVLKYNAVNVRSLFYGFFVITEFVFSFICCLLYLVMYGLLVNKFFVFICLFIYLFRCLNCAPNAEGMTCQLTCNQGSCINCLKPRGNKYQGLTEAL
jgi:hypothetical protein